MLIDKKLLLFGGKGGVGKTSMAAATAKHATSLGKKVLVLSTDPAHSLSDSFAVDVKSSPTKIDTNLFAMELDAKISLQAYKKNYGALIQQIANEGTFFSKDDIQKFFDLSLPGLDELMALLEVIEILEKKEYDILILDTAPTGHTIRLLEMPQVMEAFIRVMVQMRKKHRVVVSMMVGKYIKDKADEFIDKMYNDIQNVKAILQDHATTEFVPVLIPEVLAIHETEKLLSVLENHKIPVNTVILNQVLQNNCKFCSTRAIAQEERLKTIEKLFKNYNIIEVPSFDVEIRGQKLNILASVLYDKTFKYAQPTAGKKRINKESLQKFGSLSISTTTEFLLFGGKGGVGKTSCASAAALHESTTRKVLLFSTDPAHSLSDSFGIPIGNRITKINNNLDALEIDAHSLLEGFKRQYTAEIHSLFNSVFKSTTTATIDAPYDRKVMESLFDLCPPGIDELMALKTMMDLLTDKKYDLCILDTAPSGHAIRLLEMPEIAEQWLNTLIDIQNEYPLSFEIGDTLNNLLQTVKTLRRILNDQTKSEFVVVAIPEAMSVLETKDLTTSLMNLKITTTQLIINKINPENECSYCTKKRETQTEHIKELVEIGLQTIGVELFANDIHGIDALQELNKKLYRKHNF